MLKIDVKGFGLLELRHLVLDYNGTPAFDGRPLPGTADLTAALSRDLDVHVLTADIRGGCRRGLAGWPVTVGILSGGPEDLAKLDYVNGLGPASCAAVGNGRNDRLMLQVCALGIAVIGGEGAASAALSAADVVTTDIVKGLELLLNPLRLMAALRS